MLVIGLGVPGSETLGVTAGDIFAVSDLHLGDGGLRDKFETGRKAPELRAFLDHVGAEGGELFILGDLFELWSMNLSLLLARRREILDHLATLSVAYVPGNHDVDLVHFIGRVSRSRAAWPASCSSWWCSAAARRSTSS